MWPREASREKVIAQLRRLYVPHLPEQPLVEVANDGRADGQAAEYLDSATQTVH